MRKVWRCLFPTVVALLSGDLATAAGAEERVFSGPQPGERITPFRVVELTGPKDGTERDPVADHAGAPTAIVFIHAIERSLVPLLRVIDQYGAERKEQLKTEIVFLTADRLAGEQRVRAAAGSLKLQSRVGLSVDGLEGPGNFGLNRECMMTIVAAKENRVSTNFALVQPGIADAPKVIAALALVSGDSHPPMVEELTARSGGGGRRSGEMMRGEGAKTGGAQRPPPIDLSKFDLNSESGLRDAVRALVGEVQALRSEVADLRSRNGAAAAAPAAERPKEDFPGAVPTDARLQGLLRRFIRPENDEATVDRLLTEVQEYIKGDADLTRQAMDGWTRVLHFGDRYGTAHAREVGREFLAKLKAEAPK